MAKLPSPEEEPLPTSPLHPLSPTKADSTRTLHEPMSTFGKGFLSDKHRSNSSTDVSSISPMASPVIPRKYETIARGRSNDRSNSVDRGRTMIQTTRTNRSVSLGRPMAIVQGEYSSPRISAEDSMSDLPSRLRPSELRTSCGNVPQYTTGSASDENLEPSTSPHLSKKNASPVQNVLNKTYEGDRIFRTANDDALLLIQFLETSFLAIGRSDNKRPMHQFIECRETLVLHTRQFVTDSKLLVSSATQSREKLIQNVNSSMHTLARIVHYCHATMVRMSSITQAQSLGLRVKDVACAYRTTVNAANVAAGKALDDPHMKLLMRQATSLASILSTLMKSLRSLSNTNNSA